MAKKRKTAKKAKKAKKKTKKKGTKKATKKRKKKAQKRGTIRCGAVWSLPPTHATAVGCDALTSNRFRYANGKCLSSWKRFPFLFAPKVRSTRASVHRQPGKPRAH